MRSLPSEQEVSHRMVFPLRAITSRSTSDIPVKHMQLSSSSPGDIIAGSVVGASVTACRGRGEGVSGKMPNGISVTITGAGVESSMPGVGVAVGADVRADPATSSQVMQRP